MRLLPEVITELDPNIRWEMAKYLRIIEEVVLGPKVSDTGAPTMEETFRRMGQAVVRKDKKAEDAAITDYMRAEVRAWWQDFPEQGLLTDLYQRAARRRAKSGSPDSRRPPRMRMVSRWPRHCWRTSGTRSCWTPWERPTPLREFWQAKD